MKRFTIGVTTHNEEPTIDQLLTALLDLKDHEVDVIIYDDFSTDRTREIIIDHPIAKRANTTVHLATFNSGTPSIGRGVIAACASTEYITLVDGDDMIDTEEYRRLIETAPSGYDLLITSYELRGVKRSLDAPTGELYISNSSVSRVLSGIGGKSYSTAVLRRNSHDEVIARSDDVRLNMRILLNDEPRLFADSSMCFYKIANSRKSMKLKNVNFNEIAERRRNFAKLQERYGVDDKYMSSLKNNIASVIRNDATATAAEKAEALRLWRDAFATELRRIVFIVSDISQIGGIPSRISKVLRAGEKRSVEYVCLSIAQSTSVLIPGNVIFARSPEAVALCKSWSQLDTVVVTHNNLFRRLPPAIKRSLGRLPLVHVHAGQMAFFMANGKDIYEPSYVDEYKASAIVCFSEGDMNFQHQLGIFGQIKGFAPVETRDSNTFSSEKNRHFAYVGRIDYAAKGCDALLPVAEALLEADMGPLLVFTTEDKSNSPDYARFIEEIERKGIREAFEIVLECRDRDLIYDRVRMLLLPSRYEGFGNVVVEANSYGVPVISTSYAPGPAELILDGVNGFVLHEFTPHEIVRIGRLAVGDRLRSLSDAAFGKHHMYSMERHLSFLEDLGNSVLRSFDGRNSMRVFPRLPALNEIESGRNEIRVLQARLAAFEQERLEASERSLKLVDGDGSGRAKRSRALPPLKRLARLARKIGRLEEQIRREG